MVNQSHQQKGGLGKADVSRPGLKTSQKGCISETKHLNDEEESHQMAPARMLNMLPKEDEEANLMYLRTHNYKLSV